MEILKYFIVLFLALISNSFITIILITLRVGISFCNEIIFSNQYNKMEKAAAEIVRKKYFITLFADTIIALLITFLVYLFLKDVFIAYLGALFVYFLISVGKTGKNDTNCMEFHNTLKANYPYNEKNNQE